MIAGSNILVFSVKFFNYEKLIKEELISMGANVDLFDERPSNSFYSKAVIRMKKDFYKKTINRYFNAIIDKIKDNQYDYFLLIKGESTPSFFLNFLKKNNPNIKLIYYTYDSFKNNPNGLENLVYFDKKFTFDKNDSKKYDLSFRPLFFASDYSKIGAQKSSGQYDISFIGTAHSDRYSLSQIVSKWCDNNKLKMFNFYYSPSKILFALKKMTDKEFMKFDKDKISFKSLSHNEIIEIYKNSKAILDINHPGQDGLTMRTFETLGSARKLLTTNPNITSYPFYNTNNIYIINRDNPKIDQDFFSTEFKPIEEKMYYSMSLRGWLEELFEKESTIWS
ncbi:hypothetical protein BB050_02179 [Flavobacterium anhuiense]|uniref:Lipopolysaccharide biosynthesis protein n=1 Tax=Flavobacterium anhuiense TaxID=459526 RepID=A0AAC9GI85_9FLAO|nr:hypothetical protein [Flavobacterium anhuiense]AOC95295.1 hypothetical protein BB050_02179 [Flavobacterium anhuiense]